ncbi:26S proteasome regulatory subunit N7 [Capronia coronata CBS 617.96]|uniref:26S proteasome regulatory subunit N7 n=1 Tax=Capronia coronata CBS 617.96 TaxID=1182541 RepID=W9YTM4_9EURO|nr:26S proteasome regulatory subunit N7 [Capronia coronata CBS 617.96]EXJ85639.1 26S proteasome regulatory subunit N7 [Capronia coronata CBS 617.96]
MGSDSQFIKYPDLSLAQHIFSLGIETRTSQTTSLNYLQNAIREHKMAPLYRHLAHPTEGILNSVGESTAQPAIPPLKAPSRRASLVSSNLLPSKKLLSSGILPWDEALYEELKAENDKELEAYQKEEEEAEEKAGETEIQAVRSKRAEFFARIGDKASIRIDKAIAAYENVFDKTGPLGTKIDIVLAIIRIGLFFNDKAFVKKQVERADILVEGGGDWDRRNRLKAYKGLHLLTIRSYNLAAPLLLDSLSTFTSYELCSYSSLVVYAVLAGSNALKRVDFKAKVVDAPEIKAILGDGEEKAPGADEEMKDVSATTAERASGLVNLSTLGTGSAVESQTETPMDFTSLAGLVTSLYSGNYRTFFLSLAAVEENFLTQDRYLYEHRAWFVREMRLRGYQQLLQSYRVVGLATMAQAFGVSVDFLDKDLAKFIAGGRVSCTIDRVQGVIETTRPDDKNKQYADVVKQGDALITKLQKYGQAVRLRGSERA